MLDLTHCVDAPNTTMKWRVAELFAGVGGFRLGLERVGWTVVWSNQWEPSTKRQHASEIYVARFSPEGHVNKDIKQVLDEVEEGIDNLADHDLLVGGFPCQDYSVARSLSQAEGIVGKKGVLWWEIYRVLRLKRPQLIFLENVDRLLSSPAHQRGRDFAIMLACLSDMGYLVEWRVVNAADYGFPQKRRRVFIIGQLITEGTTIDNPIDWLTKDGILPKALPIESQENKLNQQLGFLVPTFTIDGDLPTITERFGKGAKSSCFKNSGISWARSVCTQEVRPSHRGSFSTLRDVLQNPSDVMEEYYVPEEQIPSWRYLKGAKSEKRVHKASGFTYSYTEGAIPFPDPIDQPSRTILTGEGGATTSRFKHIIQVEDGRLRRLTPVELERLNGFPDNWTLLPGISSGRRAFVMGNALIVGLVERIGKVLYETAINGSMGRRFVSSARMP